MIEKECVDGTNVYLVAMIRNRVSKILSYKGAIHIPRWGLDTETALNQEKTKVQRETFRNRAVVQEPT